MTGLLVEIDVEPALPPLFSVGCTPHISLSDPKVLYYISSLGIFFSQIPDYVKYLAAGGLAGYLLAKVLKSSAKPTVQGTRAAKRL